MQASNNNQHTSEPAIPVASGRLGSWHLSLGRYAQHPDELKRRYDAAAREWPGTARRFGLEPAYARALNQSGAPGILTSAGARACALDCGIGSGSLTLALNSTLPRPITYHGVDTSPAMLETAGAALAEKKLAGELHESDIRRLPFADKTYDVVMAAHVLEHLSDPHLGIAEMARVLKPGGLLFACMTRRSWFGTAIQLLWRTWAVTAVEGVRWLTVCQLVDIGLCTVSLGALAGGASIAFWARRPVETTLEIIQ